MSIYLPGGGDDDTTVVEVNIGYYNFPNPFNPRSNWTNIRYDLKETKQVAIDIYDDRENLVINLIDGEIREPGEHLEEWNGRDQDGDIVQNGVYYAILLIGTKMYVVQMSVIQ